jgi:hypothetical protein
LGIDIPRPATGALSRRRADWSASLSPAALGGLLALVVLAYVVLTSGQLALVTLGAPVVALAMWSWLRRPVGTLTAMAFVTAFEGTLRAYTAGVFPSAKIADVLIIGAILATMWRYATDRRPGIARSWPGIWLLAAYLFFTVMSLPFSTELDAAPDGFRRSVFLTMIVFPMAYIQWPPHVRLKAVKAIAGVAAAVAAYALFRKLAGPSSGELGLADQYEVFDGKPALFTPFVGRQEFAGWIAVMLPVTLTLTLMLAGRWRIVCGLTTVALGAEMFFTNTRIGLVALVAGLAVGAILLLCSRAHARHRATIGVVLIVAVFAGLAGYTVTVAGTPEGSARYEGILHPNQDPSGTRHIQKWQAAIRDLRGHPFGYGIGSAGTAHRAHGRFINQDTFVIDSSYLELAYQQGFAIMLVFVAAALLIAIWLALSALTLPNRLDASLAAAACAGFFAWFALLSTASFIERWCTLFLFLLAGLAAAPSLTPASALPADRDV